MRFSTPLHPFWCLPRTVKYVLLGMPWSTQNACSEAPPGARKSRCRSRWPQNGCRGRGLRDPGCTNLSQAYTRRGYRETQPFPTEASSFSEKASPSAALACAQLG